MKKVSVVIPIYNSVDALKRCLDGFARQSIEQDDFELIIIDDNSTDNIQSAVAPYLKNNNILLLRNNESKGAGFSRNRGMDTATGEIIILCDGDTVPCEKYIEEHLRFHAMYPDESYAVLGCVRDPIDLKMTPLMRLANCTTAWDNMDNLDNRDWTLFRTTNISLKRSFVTIRFDIVLFYESGFEDFEFGYRLHLKGMKIMYNDQALSYHYHFISPEKYIEKVLRYGRLLARWIKSCDAETQCMLNRRFNYLLDKEHLFGLYNCKEIVRRITTNSVTYPFIRLSAKLLESINEKMSVSLYYKLYKYLLLKGYKKEMRG